MSASRRFSPRLVGCFILLGTLSLLVPALLAAQTPPPPATSAANVTEPGRFAITGFVGPGFGGDLNNSPVNLGAALSYNFGPRFALEGELGYGRGAQQGELFDLDTSVLNLNANALYHFVPADSRWVPYATFGVGILRGSTDLDDLTGIGLTADQIRLLGLNEDGTDTELAVNFGGGLKTSLSSLVNFRADLRYFSGRELAPSFWRGYAGLSFVLGR